MPKQFTTEALAKGLTDVVKPGEHLLLPRALQASEELVLELQKKSVTITEIPFMMSRGLFQGICPCGRIWTWLHFSAHPALRRLFPGWVRTR